MSLPGLSWRVRLKAVPLLGDVAAWMWALMTAARFKKHVLDQLRLAQADRDRLMRQLANSESAQQVLREHVRALEIQLGRLAANPDIANALPSDCYLDLENAVRGSTEAIQSKVSAYVPRLQASVAGAGLPVFDIGCGRGEWLALLREQGFSARGADVNDAMVGACKRAGLNVAQGDGVATLLSVPANTLGAVTCFHVVEHVPAAYVLSLFEAAYRALAPGGLLIVETPNPENLQVASYSFYLDPTHRHPLPPPLLNFMARRAGFSGIEILRLNPYPQFAEEDDAYAPLLRKLLFCGQDYGLVARK